MIRVGHLIQHLEIGGLEQLVVTLADKTRQLGVQSHAYAYLTDGPIRSRLESVGAAVHHRAGGEGFSPSLGFRVARWIRRNRLNVLHSHHLGPFIYGAIGARLAGVSHIHTEHSHELYDSDRRRRVGSWMDKMATVVAVTDEVASWRASAFGRRPITITNGVDCPAPRTQAAQSRARSRLDVSPETFCIGCVARLSPEKNHARLIDGFGRLLARGVDATLCIVGDGPSAPELRKSAAPLEHRVRFLGQRDDVAQLLPGFDAFALTSEREGLPLAILEAMAHEVPIVAHAVGGIPELLRRCDGVLVDPNSVESLVDRLEDLAKDRERARVLGRKGRDLVVTHYSSERAARDYERLYRDLAGGRRYEA